MKRAFLWAVTAVVLLSAGWLGILTLAFYAGNAPDADAAHELRQALSIYGETVLYKALLPAVVVVVAVGSFVDRPGSSVRRSLSLLGGVSALAAVGFAASLLRTEAFGLPAVVYTGVPNFCVTVLQMTVGLVLAVAIPRWLLPALR